MKREYLTIDGHGQLSMLIGCDRIWMTEIELAELFGVLVPMIRAAGGQSALQKRYCTGIRDKAMYSPTERKLCRRL